MKQKLQTRLAQHFALTPQLQQSIKLLQLSSLELNEEIERALLDNPLLERLDDPLANTTRFQADGSIIRPVAPPGPDAAGIGSSPAQSTEHHDEPNAFDNLSGAAETEHLIWDSAKQSDRHPDDERFQPQLEAPPESLKEHLLSQMRLTVRDQRQRALVELMIDALDTNGYLQETLGEMLEWLPPELNIDYAELEDALACIQNFDPPGVGSRNSAECLAIQIRLMQNIPYIVRKRALNIVENHLKLFAQRDFNRLKKALSCDDEDLLEAQAVIQRCNPHPGAAFANDAADMIVPEIIAVKKDGVWHAELNMDAVPKIRINQLYGDILKTTSNTTSLNTRFQEAKWLIRNINQRFDTILKVSEAIIERQQNFFSLGPSAMRPLVLREIADTLGLHESTISRVTTQKFMLTPLGIFELKYFFGSHIATEGGGEASSTAIREKIRQLIAQEDSKKPYSDNKIAQLLEKEGLVIARRTIAKYRDILKIPPASLRKTL